MARLKERFERIAKGESHLGFDPLAREEPRLAQLRVEQIERDPTQPRREMGDLQSLTASIQEHGVLEPLIVSPLGEQSYLLITGERRFTAAKEAGLTTVPALVRSVQEHQRLAIQLVENLHRKDLSPLEEAGGYQRLIAEFSLTQEEVARRVGKSRPVINETLRLLDLAETIVAECRTSDIASKSLLLEIAKQPTEDEQQRLWDQARRGELTVKKAREQKKSTVRPGALPTEGRKAMAFRYPIQTDDALVTLTFERPSATQEEIIAALEQALEGERARLETR